MKPRRSAGTVGQVLGFRSGLEELNADLLQRLGVPFDYEAYKLSYVKKPATYLTDFILPNGIIVETKGHFVSEDRTKHVLIKAQHPGLDLRFVFSNPRTKIGKKSETTYGRWCELKGFAYATKTIPLVWILEPPEPARVAAAMKAFDWIVPAWAPDEIARLRTLVVDKPPVTNRPKRKLNP